MSNESNPDSLEEKVVSQIIDSSSLTKYAAKEPDWAKIGGYLLVYHPVNSQDSPAVQSTPTDKADFGINL